MTPAEAETKVRAITSQLNARGKNMPTSVTSIPGFPFPSFDALRIAIERRDILLQRFSVHPHGGTFDLLASRAERALSRFYMLLAFLTPIAAVVFAVMYSWWFALGALGLFVFLGRGKALYNHVVLSSAARSDTLFSFLYYTRQVCLTSPDYSNSLYWRDDQA